MHVSVARYALTVDVRDTVESLLDCTDRARGAKLDDALSAAREYHDDIAAFAVPPFARVEPDDVRPDGEDVWPEIGGRDEADVLRNLEKAGLVELATLWQETSSNSYLSDGRIITAVRVRRAFSVVTVAYRHRHAHIFELPDRWTVTGRTRVVDAGTYVVAEVGDFRTSYVGAGGVDTAGDNDRGVDLDTLTCWAAECQGFLASDCLAECDTCKARWATDAGSWEFQPERDGPDGVAAFAYDDAEDHDGESIACPHCATGRVGFLIV